MAKDGVKDTAVKAGKKLLSTDAAQDLVRTVADKMEAIAVEQADEVSEKVKTKAAKAGGRKTPSRKAPSRKTSSAKRSSAKRTSTRKTGSKRSTSRTSTSRKSHEGFDREALGYTQGHVDENQEIDREANGVAEGGLEEAALTAASPRRRGVSINRR